MMIASMDYNIEALIYISKLSYLLNAYGCEMTIYYEQDKVEIIQSACNFPVSIHNHNNFSTASDNKVKH